jgi:hypothetical protein
LYAEDKFKKKINLMGEWMEHRFGLFEKYCFPSVQNQSDHDFLWICLFSDKTPYEYKERIKALTNKMENFVPCFLNSSLFDQKPLNDVIADIVTELKNDSPLLVTARLDNDDAINKDFMREISQLASKQDVKECIYLFTNGLQYVEYRHVAVNYQYEMNHFGIYVCRDYNAQRFMRTIYDVVHTNYSTCDVPYECLDLKKNFWLEVVHMHNVYNLPNYKGLPILNKRFLKQEFAVDADISIYNSLKYLIRVLMKLPT